MRRPLLSSVSLTPCFPVDQEISGRRLNEVNLLAPLLMDVQNVVSLHMLLQISMLICIRVSGLMIGK